MNSQDFKRKLTAIFSADVAGYSRLMGEDEAATVKTLEAYKQVMFFPDQAAPGPDHRLTGGQCPRRVFECGRCCCMRC